MAKSTRGRRRIVSGQFRKEDENPYNSSNVKKAKLNSTLTALLDDPILSDVPIKSSLSDVDTLISLELGSAMRISILKMDGTSFDVPVMNTATAKDLKLGIKKKVNESEQSTMGHHHISWKHVWGNFCLSYHNEKLLDGNVALQDYGMRNNSGAFYPICHVMVFSKAFKKEEASLFSWSQQKIHSPVILALVLLYPG